MARHRRLSGSATEITIETLVATAPPKRPPPTKPKRRDFTNRAARFTEEVEEFRTSEAGWEKAEAGHLVGLYSYFHESIYGVLPEELRADWLAAESSARKLIREEFDNDVAAAARFLAWCWSREKANERRKKQRGLVSDWRIGWRYQFVSRNLLTDYRVASARKARL